MAQRHVIFTTEQAAALHHAYLHTKDGPTRTRYQAVRLYGLDYPVAQVQEMSGCSRTSLMDWCRSYRTHGLDGLIDARVGGNRATLPSDQRQRGAVKLRAYAPRHLCGAEAATPSGPFWTIPDLKRAVERWFGVSWNSPTSDPSMLIDAGSSYQRTQQVFTSRHDAQVMTCAEQVETT